MYTQIEITTVCNSKCFYCPNDTLEKMHMSWSCFEKINGRIDGIDEMFGNLTQSGFDELKQLIDSNHDNKIDRKDELFNQLQVRNDLNGDAKVQEGELRSLDEAGVVNIDLSLVETNIDINGNTLTEASKYTTDEDHMYQGINILTCKDFHTTKSLHVRTKINQKGATHGTQQKVA